jgi:iron complex transport system substrate-binding protein
LSDVYAMLDTLGTMLEVSRAAAQMRDSMRATIHRLRSIDHGVHPKVLFLIWHDPATAAGRDTYVDELITVAGGRNAAADAHGRWPELSLESVLERDPDFIILPRSANSAVTVQTLSRLPGWSSMKAVRQSHVITVDGDLFERAGPHAIEAARILLRAIHPEAVVQ